MMTNPSRLATAMNSSTDPRVLQTLGMEGVSLALWTRAMPEDLAKALDVLAPDRLPRLRCRLSPRDVADAVRTACFEAGTGACAGPLAAEAESLAAHAMQVFASPLLEVRLDVTEGQPCPKWHIDAVPGRLICTLRGPGTEYAAIRPNGEPRSTHRMARGAVGAFRGSLWPGRDRAAIVHRSPPADAGGPRLLIVIDPVDTMGTC
jgi:hypothetical protein